MSQSNDRKPRRDEEPRRGPGNAAAHGKIRIDKNSVVLFKRLMSFMKGRYLATFVLSLSLMIITALVSVRSSTFLGTLIDDYIKPLVGTADPDFSGLFRAILGLAGLYVLSIFATFAYNILLVGVSNGVLKEIRSKLFAHM